MHHTIEYLLFPDALGLDLMGPLEVFNTATAILERQGKTDGGYRARFVAADKGPVRRSCADGQWCPGGGGHAQLRGGAGAGYGFGAGVLHRHNDGHGR